MSKFRKAVEGAQASNKMGGFRGTLIMKSISLFMKSGRRASNRDKGNSVDATEKRKRNESMDASGKINPILLESLKKKTHFTKIELESLCRIYKKLVTSCQMQSKALAATSSSSVISKPTLTEGIDRIVFRELLHSTFDIITEEILMERIFCAWEKGQEGLNLRLEGWITGLSVFLRGTPAERMSFCFRVYDLNSDGYITRDEMFTLLRNCLIKQPQDEDPDEGVRDLVEIALRKFDIDKDSKVSFQDFIAAVTDEPLLMEAFGNCLPSTQATVSFLSTLQCQGT